MTTNKPEVVAWIWDYRGRHMATTDYSQALELAEPPYPTEVEPLIRLADYQRLQAETERLQAEFEKLRAALDESRANDQQAMRYLKQVREIVGGDDFPDMVERVARLQAKCEYYKSALLEATDRSVSDSWKRVSTDKKLDQYLSVGIAQIEEERDRYKADCEKLRSLLRRAQPIIKAHAGASHMLEGFRPRRNQWDELMEAIDAAMEERNP